MKLKFAAATLLCSLFSAAQADTITLDFETFDTGIAFNSGNTLSTALGDITLDNDGSPCGGAMSQQVRGGTEINSNVLCLFDNGTFDMLTFDFDVDSISGETELRAGGSVLVEILDFGGLVIDSFLTSASIDMFSFNPSEAIRALRISDPDLNFSGLDNLVITTSAQVAEPGVLGLLGLGFAGMALSRRRKLV